MVNASKKHKNLAKQTRIGPSLSASRYLIEGSEEAMQVYYQYECISVDSEELRTILICR